MSLTHEQKSWDFYFVTCSAFTSTFFLLPHAKTPAIPGADRGKRNEDLNEKRERDPQNQGTYNGGERVNLQQK
jgi:hypothetical protein